jgi:inhibitor of cysteine peptidase
MLVAAVVLLALGVAACGGSSTSSPTASPEPSASSSPAAAQTVKVTEAQLPAVVNLKVGDQLKVLLNSNTASTGYVWTAEGLDQEAILEQIGKPVDIPSKSTLVGAAGKTEFTFKAMEQGTEELGFWYARPSDAGNPGAAAALIVKVAKGHVPVEVKAGEDYTAETAVIRTGDTLQVVIKHASSQGKVSWKLASSTAPVKVTGGQKYTEANGGTITMDFIGTAPGTGTLVLVNQPAGSAPLETYALPVYVKPVKQPVTIQVNQKDANETFAARVGDTVQLTLPGQPSTGYQWVFNTTSVMKQVGKPQFTPNNETMGAKGKTMWTFDVVSAGTVAMRALLEGPDAGSTGPAQEFDFTVAAKPGFKPQVVQAVDSNSAPTVHLKPGDQLKLTLDAQAGTWVPQGTSAQLVYSKPAVSGSAAVVTYTAKQAGTTTQVLLAETSGGWPNQAYAFSAVVGSGSLPKTVTAVDRHVGQSVLLSTGETLTVELPGNSSTGYAWTVSPLATPGVIEQVGDVAFTANPGLMGAPGKFTVQFKGVGTGSVPLLLLYEGPGSEPTLESIWMMMVSVR